MTAPINPDIAAIEAALAAGPIPLVEWTRYQGHVSIPETEDWREIDINCNAASNKLVGKHLAHYIAAAHPARLRRVLDTMRLMGEALEACLPSIDPYSRERAEADAALAAYRGETK